MPRQVWTLTDVDRDEYMPELRLEPAETGGFTVHKRTLRGGLREGVDVVEIDNGVLRVVLLPNRGMGLWRAWHGETELGWQSPVKGPVHPAFVPVSDPGGIGWLRGFDELLCRCGLEFNGAPEWDLDGKLLCTLHGRIANLPAHKVQVKLDKAQELAVTGVVDEARLFGNNLRLTSTLRVRPGEPVLWITDEVANLSALPGELELLYHINFGLPLAGPGSRVFAPVRALAPRDIHSANDVATWQDYGPEQPGAHEVVHYFELISDSNDWTTALLVEPAGQRGVSLHFNRGQLPTFSLWKTRQAAADGYVTGLEPGLNFPNVKSFERTQGRVAILAPGESRRFEIGIEVHAGAQCIGEAHARIAELQGGIEPRIFERPRAEWSPP